MKDIHSSKTSIILTNSLSLTILGLIAVMGVQAFSTDLQNEQVPQNNWKYRTSIDELDGDIIHYAEVTANKKLFFDFPFDGGIDVRLVIRTKKGKTDVMLILSDGMFAQTEGRIRVKFDNDHPVNFYIVSSSDGSYDTIFFNNSKRMLSKLKTAKKTLIEAHFHNEGKHVLTFNTEGLLLKY